MRMPLTLAPAALAGLTIAGSAEFTPSFVPYAQELAQLGGGRCHIVDGAPHSYAGYERQVAGLIADWLNNLRPSTHPSTGQ